VEGGLRGHSRRQGSPLDRGRCVHRGGDGRHRLEADLERSIAVRLRCRSADLLDADHPHRSGQGHGRLALPLLDLAGQALLDVPAARVHLLDLLEDRDRLGGEAVARVLVGERQEESHGLLLLVGQDQDVGELHAQARVGALLLELGLQDLDRAGVLLRGDEGNDVLFLRLPEADRQGPSGYREETKGVRPSGQSGAAHALLTHATAAAGVCRRSGATRRSPWKRR
jgi:hypothetical protein